MFVVQERLGEILKTILTIGSCPRVAVETERLHSSLLSVLATLKAASAYIIFNMQEENFEHQHDVFEEKSKLSGLIIEVLYRKCQELRTYPTYPLEYRRVYHWEDWQERFAIMRN